MHYPSMPLGAAEEDTMTLNPGDVVESISNGKVAVRKANGSLEVNGQRVETQAAGHVLTDKQTEALAKVHAAGERGLDFTDGKGRVTINGNCFNALRSAGLVESRATGETYTRLQRSSARRSAPKQKVTCHVTRIFLTKAGRAAIGA